MNRNDNIYKNYVNILHEELRPAMGCTEPIAIAYAAAKARAALGKMPERVINEVSGNIIKNVKSVVVPHTGGMRGIEAATAAGIVAGDENAELEVLSHVTPEEIENIAEFIKSTPIEVVYADTPHIFDILISVYAGEECATVRIVGHHTNIVLIKKNDTVLFEKNCLEEDEDLTDRSCLSVEKIVEFADSVELSDISPLLERQIELNMAIAEEGLKNDYGANIGKVLLKRNEYDITLRMRAYAAAGSDARMNGCEMPVIINSGSGNQGITASVPVIVYAATTGKTHEQLLRALTVSNLITIHLKSGIGYLSAYCGAVSAGCGAGAGIAYIEGGKTPEVAHTVVNSIAINSGIICDGAKASCAAKIASAVEGGLMGLEMFKNGNQFFGGEGIVKSGVENTIASVSRLAKLGMEETDKEIIKLMLDV